jgi:hypothetical protein
MVLSLLLFAIAIWMVYRLDEPISSVPSIQLWHLILVERPRPWFLLFFRDDWQTASSFYIVSSIRWRPTNGLCGIIVTVNRYVYIRARHEFRNCKRQMRSGGSSGRVWWWDKVGLHLSHLSNVHFPSLKFPVSSHHPVSDLRKSIMQCIHLHLNPCPQMKYKFDCFPISARRTSSSFPLSSFLFLSFSRSLRLFIAVVYGAMGRFFLAYRSRSSGQRIEVGGMVTPTTCIPSLGPPLCLYVHSGEDTSDVVLVM